MSEAFDSIETGLKQALAYALGEGHAIVHEVEVPDPDMRRIRARTGLSQADFARSIGVKEPKMRNREHNCRSPDGALRVLLALIARDPGFVERVLGRS